MSPDWVRRIILAVVLTGFGGVPSIAGGVIAGPASAVDGDSLEVAGQEIRLHGIDAPEWEQLCNRKSERYPCGQVAARALADRIDGRHAECDVQDVDRYGRAVGVCFLDGKDLNGWLVRRGHAVAYRRYSRAYVDEEEAAQAARRGVWAGEFVMPWQWRRGER